MEFSIDKLPLGVHNRSDAKKPTPFLENSIAPYYACDFIHMNGKKPTPIKDMKSIDISNIYGII